MTYIDHGQPHQIFRVGPAREQTVVIRDKLRVNTRFLAHVHNLFQMVIIFQGKGYRDLIQLTLGQDIGQIPDAAQHLDPLVQCPARHAVVQNPSHHISPLRVAVDAVDIFLRRTGIPHQQDIFEIIAFFTEILQQNADQRPAQGREYDVEHIEIAHHQPGKMNLGNHIPTGHQDDQAHSVGLKDIEDLVLMDCRALRRIQVKSVIEHQTAGHDHDQHLKIGAHGKCPNTGVAVGKRTGKLQIPGQHIGRRYHHSVQH